MRITRFWIICCVLSSTAVASPPLPAPGDLFGWELPKLVSIDTINFPRRLVRNRSFGRVIAELDLRYDGSIDGIDFVYVENGDLTRWAEKILSSAVFTPARLDQSPQACKLPVHVLFLPADEQNPPRYQVWLPTDSASYRTALRHHFLAANQSVAPLLLRAGSYIRPPGDDTADGTVVFEVYVKKDGSRENGSVVQSPGDEFTREALAAMVDMRILPARYRNASYGCWIRIVLGFYSDWDYPTQPVDLAAAPYHGWPAPTVTSVGANIEQPPLFRDLDTAGAAVNLERIRRAGDIVYGQATFMLHIDSTGHVMEWMQSRPVQTDALALDAQYSEFKFPGSTLSSPAVTAAESYPLSELAKIAAADMENIVPYMVFLPGRSRDGTPEDLWITITPTLLR